MPKDLNVRVRDLERKVADLELQLHLERQKNFPSYPYPYYPVYPQSPHPYPNWPWGPPYEITCNNQQNAPATAVDVLDNDITSVPSVFSH